MYIYIDICKYSNVLVFFSSLTLGRDPRQELRFIHMCVCTCSSEPHNNNNNSNNIFNNNVCGRSFVYSLTQQVAAVLRPSLNFRRLINFRKCARPYRASAWLKQNCFHVFAQILLAVSLRRESIVP